MKEEKTIEVAIVKVTNVNVDEYDGSFYRIVAQSITDWDRVTEEEFRALVSFERNYDYRVIRREPTDELVTKAVSDYLIRIEQAKQAEEKRKKEAKERAEKRKKATLAKKKRAFEKLAKELAGEMSLNQ